MSELFEAVAEAYRNMTPWTISQLRVFVEHVFHISLEQSTLAHMIERNPRLKTYPGVSMEAARVAVTSEQIDNFFQEAFRITESVPAHFIFHLDETGHQKWADRKAIPCGVPPFHEGHHVNFPVARIGKRITLMACIALDGSFLKPMGIVPRKTGDNSRIVS
jgi:hypothetical protein